FSFDDPHTVSNELMSWQTRDLLIRQTLENYGIQAILFVCGKRVDSDSGQEMIEEWDREGHLIGNHSYSHYYYHSSQLTYQLFRDDILKNDSLINDFSNSVPLFRFPYLKQGDTREKIDSINNFLKQTNYRIGHVSIDASDWYVDQRMLEKYQQEGEVDLNTYRDFYLEHILERAKFYDHLATELTGRKVNHVILLHHNTVSALFLDDLIEAFIEQGWEIIPAQQAYQDPIYVFVPDIIPAGESIIWAMAKESGRYQEILRYPAEDGRYEQDKMDSLGL
ncbi:MAG: polysaccharide deacetylase family protein, partial [bacterium]